MATLTSSDSDTSEKRAGRGVNGVFHGDRFAALPVLMRVMVASDLDAKIINKKNHVSKLNFEKPKTVA